MTNMENFKWHTLVAVVQRAAALLLVLLLAGAIEAGLLRRDVLECVELAVPQRDAPAKLLFE